MPQRQLSALVRSLADLLEREGEKERADWLRVQAAELDGGRAERTRRKLAVQLSGGMGSILDLALGDDQANEDKWELIEKISRHIEVPTSSSSRWVEPRACFSM